TIKFLLGNARTVFVVAVIAGIISGVSNAGLLALITATLGQAGRTTTLVWAFVALCVVAPLTRIASEMILIHLGQKAIFDLRMRLSRSILGVPLRQLEELGAHRLTAALTEDVMAVSGAIVFLPILCINIAVVVGCLIYLGWLSWSVLLAVVGAIVIGILTYQLPIMRAVRYLRLAREEEDSLFGHFRALIEGVKELQLHRRRREAFLTDILESTATSFRKQNVTGMATYAVASSWGQLLVFVVIGLLLFVLPGWANINNVALIGYALTILYMMTPLQVIMNTMPALGRANVSLNKIEQLGLSLAASSEAGERGGAETALLLTPGAAIESLEAVGVTHTYYREGEENNFTLGPIDLSFTPGEIVFLVGGNGSGKTTFAKILLGLYSPEGGEIRLNGRPVTDGARESYRQLFSAVFSDFFLFESLLGLDHPELEAKAHEYLKRLRLDHKVQVTGNNLSTTKLSQGQRKRLALLSAYLEDRPAYLFDEWAADQDPVFKEIFYLELLPELKARGKTVFVISHDDRYYHVGDRIIKLEDGQVEYDQRPVDAYAAGLHDDQARYLQPA
ncbi:MAG TPA: cyclic peptide export ABC transporter, partial [Gemmatimonadales bacterium]|nr:cyclic peptide export ABC transporter [Gemmatimonadales bacterium]